MTESNNDKCTNPDSYAVAQARRVTWISFFVNAILGVAKILGGLFARSSALIADGVHSFSDFLSDIVVIVMVGLARKRPDADHQFGHGRFEALATILLSLLLIGVAIGILYDSVERIISVINGETLPRPGVVALIILLLSIVAKEWLFYITKRVGERIHSDSVVANAWHHRSDSWSSLATLIGVAGAMFLGEKWRVLDPVAALIVAVFIAVVGVKMARPALNELLGASLPESDLKTIKETLAKIPDIKSWHALRTFKSGNDIYIEVHIKVDPEINVLEAHKIATRAEHAIKRALKGHTVYVTTHIEPDLP
ncbi:MAG: cation diffusion facilitator family transporter [Muribaculaceae bacterium]|nr:cation diffusion facilitator family transporter [Muribaculaceae bacterium]